MSGPTPDLAVLFARFRDGDAAALGDVISALYAELHALAAHRMRGENRRHTLQPTSLIHECYLRLMRGPAVINDRNHFLALAAQAMRRVLVDHARRKRSEKRGGDRQQVTLDSVPGRDSVDIDVLALNQALDELAGLDERAAQVVELRFFGGHTDREVSEILGLTLPAVRRDWVFARSFLKTRLSPEALA